MAPPGGIVRSIILIALAATFAAQPGTAQAVAGQRWIASWGTAQALGPAAPPPVMAPPPADMEARPDAGGRAAPPPPPPPSPFVPHPEVLADQTVRMVVRASAGGPQIRLAFSNASGGAPVVFGAVRAALSAGDDATVAGSDRAVTFGGRTTLTLFPGAQAVSDPIDLAVPALAPVAVSIHLPAATPLNTVHALGLTPAFIAQGDRTADGRLPGAQAVRSYFWLTGLSVPAADEDAGAIVALGDSITDGFATTPGRFAAWPDRLAARLQADPRTRGWGVVNAGISGNRVLKAGAGDAAVARFDEDVLARPGVRWLILLEGINDINMSIMPIMPPAERVSAAQIIDGLGQIVDRAHLHGIKVAGATLLATRGLPFYSARGEAMRQAVNQWIRTSGRFDAVIDFDAATRDPADPLRLLPAFDPGDHVHPNDAGNRAMADAIDLAIFR